MNQLIPKILNFGKDFRKILKDSRDSNKILLRFFQVIFQVISIIQCNECATMQICASVGAGVLGSEKDFTFWNSNVEFEFDLLLP